MSSVQTKIYFTPGEQVRRLKIDSNVSFNEFKEQLTKLHEASPVFKIGQYVYDIMYQDEEGDWVMVDSQEEWEDALRSHNHKALFRIKFIATNKSLQSINKCRKDCQKAVTERYNNNVKPLIHQLKEYLKDPQKHNEAKEWLKELTAKLGNQAQSIGNQAQSGFSEIHHKVDSWIKNNELPQAVEVYMKEFENIANTLVDRVEGVIAHNFNTQEEEEEIEEREVPIIDDVIQPVEESHIQLHEEVQPEEEDEIIEEPIQEEVIVPVVEVKEPEIEIPKEYVDSMRSLTEMGFQDKELNLRLLKEKKGDLIKVVSALLSLPL